MPAVTSGLVLVTGASGFVGTYTVQALLDAGFAVRGTVRSKEKGEHLVSLSPKASYVLVPDMSAPGAYDEAVAGVDAVVHIASPLDGSNTGDPSLVIGPAVAGVTGVLHSLEKANPNVKRIVCMSSIAAISAGMDGPSVHTEADWNDFVVALCDQLGAKASGPAKYAASKAVAEKAFWSFFEEKQPKFDGVALNPSFIFGPPTQFTESAGAVVGSNSLALPFMKPGVAQEALDAQQLSLVHVRDVANASVAALKTQEAAGERFIVSVDELFGNDFAIAAQKALPNQGINANPDPAYRAGLEVKAVRFDGSKAVKVLGVKYHGKDETLAETVAALVAHKSKM